MKKEILANVLSIIWNRVEELNKADIRAVTRCVESSFGKGKMDQDFAERLQQQQELLEKREEKAMSVAQKLENPGTQKDQAANTVVENAAISADDLFDDLV